MSRFETDIFLHETKVTNSNIDILKSKKHQPKRHAWSLPLSLLESYGCLPMLSCLFIPKEQKQTQILQDLPHSSFTESTQTIGFRNAPRYSKKVVVALLGTCMWTIVHMTSSQNPRVFVKVYQCSEVAIKKTHNLQIGFILNGRD